MRIYTRTGDAGQTGLFGGGRVSKDHARVMAYGDVDELNAAIGLVRATAPVELFDAELTQIQRDLFALGGQLASPEPAKVEAALTKAALSETRVTDFERAIDAAESELPALRAFVLPAGTEKSATLHLARTICRRAERSVVTLGREASLPPLFLVYLNRLSDYLFVLARLANQRAGEPSRRQLLSEHASHGMAEQHRSRRQRGKKSLELGAIIGHADPDQVLAAGNRLRAVADQIRGMARPTEAREHSPELVEAPGALIGAVDHDDVLGHGTIPVPLPCPGPSGGQAEHR